MRHLIALFIFLAAVAAYALGLGPLYFGAPLVGSVLVFVGVLFELAFWLRLFRKTPTASSAGK